MTARLISDRLGVAHPLLGFSRSPAVVASVTKAGGFGVLAATAHRPHELDAALAWIDDATGGGAYGVDLLVPTDLGIDPRQLSPDRLRALIPIEHRAFLEELMTEYEIPELGAAKAARTSAADVAGALVAEGIDELLDVALAHPIRLVASALGPPPAEMVGRAKEAGALVAALVGTAEHARRQLEAGVDVLVAQGTEAAGHTGTISTIVLTPEIVDLAAPLPVLAAGGIASGRQMAAALALGAAGVWTGSIWLSSIEDLAPEALKRKLLAASSDHTVRSAARTGKPARQLRSAWHDHWERPDAPEPLPMPLQLIIAQEAFERIDAAAEAGHSGAAELETFFVGQVVGQLRELRPAESIARDLIDGYAAALRDGVGKAGT